MKYIISIICLFLLAGCGLKTPQRPTICDEIPGNSYLCDLAEEQDTQLEVIRDGLILAEIVARQGKEEKFLEAYKDLRDSLFLETLTYRQFKNDLDPELLEIVSLYVPVFDRTQVILSKDRKIIYRWLDKRIARLKLLSSEAPVSK